MARIRTDLAVSSCVLVMVAPLRLPDFNSFHMGRIISDWSAWKPASARIISVAGSKRLVTMPG